MKPLMIAVACFSLTGVAVAQIATATSSGSGVIEITPAAEGRDAVTTERPRESTPGENRVWAASWVMGRSIFATGQPSGAAWQTDDMIQTMPADWLQIATVKDIVVDETGQLSGYVTDIGGFLGLGAKEVLLGREALHLVQVGDKMVFATNFTRDEMRALPDFDDSSVLK